MFKKWTLSTFFIAFASLLAIPSFAGKNKELDTFRMKTSLCLYWECPNVYMKETGLAKVTTSEGRINLLQSVTKVRRDANFFASKVVYTESSNDAEHIYKFVQVRVAPGDKLSLFDIKGETPLPEVTKRALLNFDDSKALQLKINGQALITKELSITHQALQNLMMDGVISPPNNQFGAITNARKLNRFLLEN